MSFTVPFLTISPSLMSQTGNESSQVKDVAMLRHARKTNRYVTRCQRNNTSRAARAAFAR